MRTSSNTQNQATVQNGRVVVQNVQGRQNKVQGNNATLLVVAGNEGLSTELEKMLLMQAQENGVDLDEEQLLSYMPPPSGLMVLKANLSFALLTDPVYDEAGPSYDSDTLSEDAICVTSNNVVNASLTVKLARYKELAEVAICYKNPFYLSKAKQVQPALYNSYEIVKTNHACALVHDSADTLEIAETTKKQMLEKMKDLESRDEPASRAEALRDERSFDQMESECGPHAVDKKCDEIKRKNLLIENENLIAACLSKDVFCTTIDSVLNVSRFSDMHNAYTIAQKCIAELEAENSNLTQKIQKDDHDEMIKHFSKLECTGTDTPYLPIMRRLGGLHNRILQISSFKLQPFAIFHQLLHNFLTSSDALAFESVFEIGHLKEQLQGRSNTIREMKAKISRLKKKHSEADIILDFKALHSSGTKRREGMQK
ncbi:hypothetical protein Tco_1475317 [Tanacetum coccineum]